MSEGDFPSTAEGTRRFMDDLTFEPGADLPAPEEVPPPELASDVMVPRSVRWPLELDRRVKAAAEARGVTMSQLIRDWAELELAALEDDRPISRADAFRALAGVRPVSPPVPPPERPGHAA